LLHGTLLFMLHQLWQTRQEMGRIVSALAWLLCTGRWPSVLTLELLPATLLLLLGAGSQPALSSKQPS
jgi:hypothetical protein